MPISLGAESVGPSVITPDAVPRGSDTIGTRAALARRPAAFLRSYIRRRPAQFGTLVTLVVLAALCAVGVQYGMELIVDAMAVDVRSDLFRHLSGHASAYFSQQLVGSLGNRVTATAGATASSLQTGVWKILPPCVDFFGAVLVIATIDHRMSLALIGSVAIVALPMTWVGMRARPLQQRFAEAASRLGGELIDVVSNMQTVQAFSASTREYRRLQASFEHEATVQRTSWLYLEKARMVHDLLLWLMSGCMLVWAVSAWRDVAAFDRIVVLVDGRIVEDGPPAVLLAAHGVYAGMWRLQAEGLDTGASPARRLEDPLDADA